MSNSTALGIVDEASGGWGGGNCNGCAVMLVDVQSGTIYQEITPGNDNSFSSIDFSPNDALMVTGGDGEVHIYNMTSGQTLRTISQGNENYNDVHFSPDGNLVAACSASSGGGSELRVWNPITGVSVFSDTGTTSCYSAQISPDGKQVMFAMNWYGADGATTIIYDIQSGIEIDRVSSSRVNGCTQNQNSNNCAAHYGSAWHPDGHDIAVSVGRRADGLYFFPQTSTLIKMDGIVLTKVMERSISSLMNQLNGTILTTMDLGTTRLLLSNQIHVCLLGATLLKTDLVARMQMVTDGPTKETYGRLTQNNGLMRTWMDMGITTSMTWITSYSM